MQQFNTLLKCNPSLCYGPQDVFQVPEFACRLVIAFPPIVITISTKAWGAAKTFVVLKGSLVVQNNLPNGTQAFGFFSLWHIRVLFQPFK